MDQPGLWLSTTYAAAKLATGLWCAQLALTALRAGRPMYGWQTLVALLTLAASGWAWQTKGLPIWWSQTWLAGGILAAAALIDGLRHWLSQPPPAQPEAQSPSRFLAIRFLGIAGFLLGTLATARAISTQLPAGYQAPIALGLYLAATAGLYGVLMASTLELTVGALGLDLLALAWRKLSHMATACFVVQIALAILIVAKLQPAETPEQTAAPAIFGLGLTLLGYIAWSIPRRLVALTKARKVEGQSSLALAGWIGLICLTLAMALPAHWPWNVLAQ